LQQRRAGWNIFGMSRFLIIQDKLDKLLDARLAGVAEQGNPMLHGKYGRKAMCASINVDSEKQTHQKPPRSVGRIAGEILAGSALGLVALLVVYAVSWIVLVAAILPLASTGEWPETKWAGIGLLTMFVIVFAPLNGLGSAAGVYLVGARSKQTGSFSLTLVGSCVGGFVVATFVAFSLFSKRPKIVLLALLLLIPPILATVCFNLTRRYKELPSS
jgi:hypothetical protein